MCVSHLTSLFFFFNDTATTEIYTLSLHDALPILHGGAGVRIFLTERVALRVEGRGIYVPSTKMPRPSTRRATRDRKSTRLNSSHVRISYAVFCLKKKKNNTHLMYCRMHNSKHADS